MKYTEEEIKTLIEEYDGTPESVIALAKQLGRSVPSVRAKLSTMKIEDPDHERYGLSVYVSPNAKPKYALEGVVETRVTKEDIVAEIGSILSSINGSKLELGSLSKCGKLDLVNMLGALKKI